MSGTDGRRPMADASTIDAIVARHVDREGPLLPILHEIMDSLGHIPDTCFERIAHPLGMTRAEVHGVVSFYHDFREAPAGRHVIKLCRAEACQAQGSAAVERDVLKRLGLDDFGTREDGSVTVEAVYCLGLCACGPAALVNDVPRGRVTAEMLSTEVAG